jgi:hypothetical protein
LKHYFYISIIRIEISSSFATSSAVAEGSDLADGLSAHLKQIKYSHSQAFKLHAAFLRLQILDEEDRVLQSFTSHSQPYSGSDEINFFNEEFIFEQALPTYAIQVSTFFCQYVSPGSSADQCAGSMILPLNRLEENVPVSGIHADESIYIYHNVLLFHNALHVIIGGAVVSAVTIRLQRSLHQECCEV